jgi:hypothetical protein
LFFKKFERRNWLTVIYEVLEVFNGLIGFFVGSSGRGLTGEEGGGDEGYRTVQVVWDNHGVAGGIGVIVIGSHYGLIVG